jgi:hypothetical protein
VFNVKSADYSPKSRVCFNRFILTSEICQLKNVINTHVLFFQHNILLVVNKIVYVIIVICRLATREIIRTLASICSCSNLHLTRGETACVLQSLNKILLKTQKVLVKINLSYNKNEPFIKNPSLLFVSTRRD